MSVVLVVKTNSRVGTCWVSWDDKKQCRYIWEGREENDPWNLSNEEGRAFYRGTSQLNVVDCYIYFFGFEDADEERLEEMF
jgi:hypothetical protein